jgi:hypothetical protein
MRTTMATVSSTPWRPTPAPPGGSFDPDFCDVNGDAACDVQDLAILQRIVNAQPAGVQNACQAYSSP